MTQHDSLILEWKTSKISDLDFNYLFSLKKIYIHTKKKNGRENEKSIQYNSRMTI